MTVTNATCKQVFLGDGSLGSPSAPFQFSFVNGFASGVTSPAVALSYYVLIFTAADGTQTDVTISPGPSQAQVTLNAAVAGSLWGMGGSIVYQPGGVSIPAGSTLTVLRKLPATQTTSLQNQASYGQYATSVEQSEDRIVMLVQQLLEQYGRAIVVNVSDADDPAPLPPAAQRANKTLVFDSEGNPTVAEGGGGGSGTISAAMAPVVAAATLALARQHMGLRGLSVLDAGAGLQTASNAARVNSSITAVSTDQAITAADHRRIYATSSSATFTLPLAVDTFNGFEFTVIAIGGTVSLTPNAADTISGLSSGQSLVVPAGSVCRIRTNGAGSAGGIWYALAAIPAVANRYTRTNAAGIPDVLTAQQSANIDALRDVIPGTTGIELLASETVIDALDTLGGPFLRTDDNFSDLTEPKTALLNLGLDAYPVAKYGSIVVGDNSAVINAAIDAAYAAGGGTVILPPGVTQATSIVLKDRVRLVPSGRGSTLLNIGSSTYFLRAEGSLGANVSLTANAAAGATQLTVSSTAGIAVGDYLVVSDGYSYAATDATYKSGETVQVKSVDSATQLSLVGALYGSMAPGGSYTTANSAKINRVSPIIAPSIEDVEFLGDSASTTIAIHAMYALNGKFSPRVKNYGNTALLLRGVIDTEAVGGFYDDLLDDIPNGHAGYGICSAGPTAGLRVQNNTMSRCRHGFTTIGGLTGFPHAVSVTANQCHDTTQAAIDTHAAGDDILIGANDITRSAGAGISIRSRNTRVQNNDIYRVAVHGILLTEDGLSDVTIDNNKIDAADGHGISSSPSCLNLRVTRNQFTNIGLDGITLFGSGTIDSTGLVVRDNDVLGYGLAGANRAGIITSGSVGSTGAIIHGNTVAPLTGSSNYGIRTLQLTGSAVIDNKAFGTFATAVFDTGTNVSLGNKRVDNSVPQIQLDPAAAAIRSISPNANEDILLLPKGTGRLRFGTFTSSADVAIVGSIEIRDAGGTVRKMAIIA